MGEPLSPEQEADAVQAVWKNKLTAGELWCLVSFRWWRQWCHYTGFDSVHGKRDPTKAGGDRPGSINNSELQGASPLEIKQGLMEHEDYVVVEEKVWNLVHSWYGGEPVFRRRVIEVGLRKETRLDFYPIYLNCVWLNAQGEPDPTTAANKEFGRKDTFSQICAALAVQPDAAVQGRASPALPSDKKDGGSVRVWIKKRKADEKKVVAGGDAAPEDPNKAYAPVKGAESDHPLEGFNFQNGETVWFERKNDKGEWVRSAVKKNFRDFQIGDILDAKDTVGKWYESTIMDVKPDTRKILVHYNGWDSRWDVWMDFDSESLAIQNTHSEGPYVSKSVRVDSGYSWSSNDEGAPLERGAVGLKNLGNTCFMNSTLQCLSNTPILTEYFLDDTFTHEINRDNPLGWHGRVADEYGALLKDLWSGKYRSVAPSKFKQVLGEFQPRFSGYQQQDSNELLSFLLDGLHEDLNQVRKKPATAAVESNGRPDEVVAKEAWDTYQLRNQSVIVNHLQGQLKSRVSCPDCKRVSITFDPFMYLSVPLPQVKDKLQSVAVYFADPAKPLTNCSAVVAKLARISELKEALSTLLEIPAKRLVFGEVWTGKLYRMLEDDESVSDIGPKDKIFAYELPELDNVRLNDVKMAQVIHVGVRANSNYRTEAFGLPLVVLLPANKEITNAEVRAKIDAACKPWIKPDFQGAAYDIAIVDQSGRSCGICEWSSHCAGCKLPNDDKVFKVPRHGKVSFAVEWVGEGTGYADGKLAFKNHESMEKKLQSNSMEHVLDLRTCIEAFTLEEILGENDPWYCSKCAKFQQAGKKFDIWKLPDILIIHLKRFSYTKIWRDKIGTLVDFPIEGLDLKDFVVNPNEKTVFDLFAVSNHMGNMGGGHYTAYCKNLINGNWYLHDDDHVRQARPEDVISSSAYVLFYVRRGAKRK